MARGERGYNLLPKSPKSSWAACALSPVGSTVETNGVGNTHALGHLNVCLRALLYRGGLTAAPQALY